MGSKLCPMASVNKHRYYSLSNKRILKACFSWGIELLFSANLSKTLRSIYILWNGYKTLYFSTKIDSPPLANGETLQKFL